jgi:hypothetical protein
MKKYIIPILFFGSIFQQNAISATTQLVFDTYIRGVFPIEFTTIAANQNVKLTLTYDSSQQEDPAREPDTPERRAAFSSYKIIDGSAKLEIASYTWTVTTYTIEIGNNFPFATPQDFLAIDFRAAPPPEFTLLGIDDFYADFYLNIRDYTTMTFFDDTSLPSSENLFDLTNVNDGGAGISGYPEVPSTFNWSAGISRPTSYSITTIPEPHSVALIAIALSLGAFRHKRYL